MKHFIKGFFEPIKLMMNTDVSMHLEILGVIAFIASCLIGIYLVILLLDKLFGSN